MPRVAIAVLLLTTLLAACDRSPRSSQAADTPAAAMAAQPDGHGPASAPEPAAIAGDASVAAAASAATRPSTSDDRASAQPTVREVTVPAGTVLRVALDTAVASDRSRVEESVRAHLTRPISINGVTVLATGSPVTGQLTSVVRSGKVKGRAHVGLRFDRVTPAGGAEAYPMSTAAVGRTAPATKKDDTLKVVAPAAGGAIIGRIAGGRKGAAIGTAVGAGAGGAAVLATRGEEVRLGKGTVLAVRLSQPLTVRLPRQ